MATIRDVAALASVSIASVSRYLNTPEKVRQATAERIRAAMKACGYRFNYAAKVLSTQRTKTLGLVIPTITNTVFADSTRGLQDEATRRGYQVLLANADYDPAAEGRLIRHLLERQVDALVMTVSDPLAIMARETPALDIPSVFLYSTLADAPVSSVGIDNEKGGYDATAHLLDLGHERLAMLAGSFAASDRSRHRYEGYRRCLRQRGLDHDPSLVVQAPFGLEHCREAVSRLMNRAAPPTAIFASNDLMAIGAMGALRAFGLTVPQDVSVVGFDDVTFASYVTPRLTTIRQPVYEMGRLAAKVALDALEGGDAGPRHLILEHELVVRESTAPIRRMSAGFGERGFPVP
ncbi:transcriptional regulator, LacI family [Solidesulfovibrio fructosivorans JJ]]|uniref:Transcriptional regulator, LacI family n=1 Tax=Solidesulfovibrio fructosivorans JJ] TaxID=596151 RepID=E1JSS4_SOLFR|nr:LacI family DNA-binding transcriptional regulator [Solidesulfovibrio fructosivorans]EFL52557.1 transcriptional regulator, LacI family [Solidesulfovibrio fructosivorans JJ]]